MLPQQEEIQEEIPTENQSSQDTPTEVVEEPIQTVQVSTDYLQALEQQLKDQSRQLSELTTSINQPSAPIIRETPRAEAPVINPEEDRQRLLNDPRGLIREELQFVVGPLMEVAHAFQADKRFSVLDQHFKTHPKFRTAMSDPVVVDAVHNMLSQPGSTINEQTYAAALVSAAGMRHMGLLGDTPVQAPTTVTTETSTNLPTRTTPVTTAPIVRPSAPPAPAHNNNAPKKTYNENELRLMREKNMTPEQWEAWLSEDPSSVATSTIGKAAK